MRTGFDNVSDTSNGVCESMEETGGAILQVLLEKAVESGIYYMKAAERTTLTATDMTYGMMYEAHEFMERPELEENVQQAIDEEEDSEEESDTTEIEEMEDAEEEFTRVNSNDPKIVKMNEYYDTWGSWNPDDPIIKALKNSIDRSMSNVQ